MNAAARSSGAALLRQLAPHLTDRRARAIGHAAAAARFPALGRGRTDPVEEQRALLLDDERPLEGRSHGVAGVARQASKSPAACRFLHTLVRRLKPARVVEMGTAVGISALAMATALQPPARMWTVDGHAPSSEVAGEVFARVGVDVTRVVGAFDEVLLDTLSDAAPVDLLHVDGDHQEGATVRYLEVALPHLSDDAVVLFDDIRWSQGMERAWTSIAATHATGFAADLGPVGLIAR